jgi:lipopolysaccharide export system permease protein
MMRTLSRYVLKEHLGPFVFSLAVLTFLFLMQNLIEVLDMVIGKGVQVEIVLELFFLNIAWMVALTVPMAVLVAVLMAFGRLSQDGEITALRASGQSPTRLLTPVLVAGVLIAAGLVYFNDRILPEFNYRLKNLTADINALRPALTLRPGVFLETVDGYTIHLDEVDPVTSHVRGVTIIQYLDFTPPDPPRVIRADRGVMSLNQAEETLDLDLFDGTITEIRQGQSRIQSFAEMKTFMSVTGTLLQRRETGVRGDRELSIVDMKARAASRDTTRAVYARQLIEQPVPFLERVVEGRPIDLVDAGQSLRTEGRVLTAHRALQARLETAERQRDFYLRQHNRYWVEIHKKWSIPFACIAFVLIGIPLGVMSRRGGAVLSFGIALLFFVIYWVSLILGEDLADRNLMAPWFGMWLPNILVAGAGIYLLVSSVREQRFIHWEILARLVPGRLGRRLADQFSQEGRA